MDLESYKANKVVMDIIKSLGWTTICGKPDEGVLQLVREFYANLKEKEDKVFVRGKWAIMTSELINKMVGHLTMRRMHTQN